jgi:hypothetical protein
MHNIRLVALVNFKTSIVPPLKMDANKCNQFSTLMHALVNQELSNSRWPEYSSWLSNFAKFIVINMTWFVPFRMTRVLQFLPLLTGPPKWLRTLQLLFSKQTNAKRFLLTSRPHVIQLTRCKATCACKPSHGTAHRCNTPVMYTQLKYEYQRGNKHELVCLKHINPLSWENEMSYVIHSKDIDSAPPIQWWICKIRRLLHSGIEIKQHKIFRVAKFRAEPIFFLIL